jgi:hypothetical protein
MVTPMETVMATPKETARGRVPAQAQAQERAPAEVVAGARTERPE